MRRRRSSPIRCDTHANAGLVAALAVTALLLMACHSSPSAGGASANPPPGAKASAAASASATADAPNLDYVEIMLGGAGAEEAAPMIIALHGLGDRPQRFLSLFAGFDVKARLIGPHSKDRMEGGYAWFAPFSATSDESAPALLDMATQVAIFADRISKRRPTLGKPILMGFSQGGALSYTVATHHPESIAAAFPIGGWLPPPVWPSELPKDAAPILAFHGTADTRVPIERDRAGAERLTALGFRMELREIPRVEHAIPEEIRRPLFDALAKACDEARTRGPRP